MILLKMLSMKQFLETTGNAIKLKRTHAHLQQKIGPEAVTAVFVR